MKKLFVVLLCVFLAVAVIPFSVCAEEHVKEDNLLKWIYNIDFSKEPTEQEKEILIKYYQEDSDKVFNTEYAISIYENDKKIIDSMPEDLKAQVYYKEYAENNNEVFFSRGSSSLGTYGDILVTYSFTSLGSDWGVTGHAAIVHTNSSKTIESFPKGNGHENGVRIYTNNWRAKDKVYGVRVKNATSTNYKNAANYAITQANQKKPYNWNFFNKGTTAKFYCSQLVWRAWKNQGFEVDRMNLGNYEPVSPAELVGGSQTYVFYHK